MLKKIIFSSIFSMVLIIGNVYAQTALAVQELRIGSFFNGVLNPGQEFWYSVRVTDAGILTVETTGSTDTFLVAFDAQRNVLRENDDGGESYNAKIDIIVSSSTTYLFKLTGYSYDISGAFRIFASHRPMSSITELRTGSFHNGNIAGSQDYWFSFRATENGILTVETASSIDTVLAVFDENFAEVGEDDDSGEGYNAKVEIPVRQGGTYYINVRALDSVGGPYRIMANTKNLSSLIPLNPGNFLSGNLSVGQSYWYSVRTTGRGRLIVETTGSIDTILDVFNESFGHIAYDDDGGIDRNARIEINAEPNQTYLLRLRGWSDTSGPYRIFASLE